MVEYLITLSVTTRASHEPLICGARARAHFCMPRCTMETLGWRSLSSYWLQLHTSSISSSLCCDLWGCVAELDRHWSGLNATENRLKKLIQLVGLPKKSTGGRQRRRRMALGVEPTGDAAGTPFSPQCIFFCSQSLSLRFP